MIAESRTGIVRQADGNYAPARSSFDGSLVIGAGMGDYQELAQRGLIYWGANQGPGGTTTTVGLAATHTGLCINNPAGNTKNLVMLQYSIGVVGAPVALSTVGLLAGYAAGGITAHTTPLTTQCTLLSAPSTGTAKADSASTLVGTPLLYMPVGTVPITGATANVVNVQLVPHLLDLKGAIVIPPGGYIATYTSTVLTVIASFVWAEVPIQT